MNTTKKPLQLRIFFSVLALAIFSMVLYSFKTKSTLTEYYYFEFEPQPTTIPATSDYLNTSNWSALPTYTEEDESPCPDGSDFVCVLKVAKADIDNASGSTIEQRLTSHIATQTSASDYVNDADNAIKMKDRAEP